jgi:RHS repeat-associated protein
MHKRLISILLILALAAGFLPIPVSAANAATPAATRPAERGEIRERRTTHGKVFRTDKGLEHHLFLHPVHWRDESDSWQETAQQLPYQATFGAGGHGEVSFRYQQGAIRFQPKGAGQRKPLKVERNGQTVRMLDEVDGTEYRYDMGYRILKETVYLIKPPAGGELRFPFAVEGVELAAQADGSIAAVGPEGDVQWRIAAPTAEDAAGSLAPWAEQRIEGSELAITVDPDWLNDPRRAWPVAVDPTIVVETDAAAGMDTYIQDIKDRDYEDLSCVGSYTHQYSGWPEAERILIRSDSYSDCGYRYTLGLLKFNLNSLSPGGRVVRARLMLLPAYGNGTVHIRPVGQEWTERDATWGHPWTAKDPLQDLDPPAASVTVASGDKNWQEIDITPLVAEWHNGSRPNWGVALTTAADTSMSGADVEFYSSDSTLPHTQPHLIIEMEEDVTAPEVSIVAPLSGSTVTGTPSVSLDLADEQLDHVELYVDGRLKGAWEGPAPAAKRAVLTPLGGLEAGSHQIEVRARDRAGNETVRQSAFTFVGTPIPSDTAAMGIGEGRVQVAWTPVPGSGFTYNVYRTTSASGGSKVKITPSPVSGTTFVDTSPTLDVVYYYFITAVDPATGKESGFSRPVPASGKTAPSLVLRVTGSGMDRQAPRPELFDAGYSADFPLVPTAQVWRRQMRAHESLYNTNDAQYATQAGTGLVAGHLVRFDVLGTLNHYRQLVGLTPVDGPDISKLVASARTWWRGNAGASSAAATTYGAQIRLWNATQRAYALPKTSADALASLATTVSGVQTGEYLDNRGQAFLLAESLSPTGNGSTSTVTSDFAELVLTFDNAAPSYLTAAPIGSGQVLLTWEASALGYRVHRSTAPNFVADEANAVTDVLGVTQYVDSAAAGLQAGMTYYYKVTTRTASGGTLSSPTASVVMTANPAVWVTPVEGGSATLTCSNADYAVFQTMVGTAAASALDGVMAVSQCSSNSSGYTARQEYNLYLLEAVKRQLGLDLTGTELEDQIEAMYVDWAGYSEGTAGSASVKIRKSGSTSTFLSLATATQLTAPQRFVVQVPTWESYLTASSSSVSAYVRIDGATNPALLKTDLLRIGLILRPNSAAFTAGLSPEGHVNLTWGSPGLFHVYRQTGSSPALRVTAQPVMTSFVDTTVMTGQSYTYQIRPVDSTGAEGEPAAGPVSIAVPVFRAEESSLAYTPASGGWSRSSSSTSYSGNYAMFSSSTADSTHTASYTFTGNGVAYLARVGSSYGQADVYLNNVHQTSVNLYNLSIAFKQSVFTKTDLPYGTYTLKIAYKTGNSINIDALDIHRALNPPASVTAATNGQQVTLKWPEVPSAAGYHVYRQVHGSDRYERVTSGKVSGVTQWTDHTVPTGSYVVTTVASDGRESAPSAAARALLDVGQYDGGNAVLTRTGEWTQQIEPASFMRTLHLSNGASTVALQLAQGVGGYRVLGSRGPAYGTMEVHRKGVLQKSVSLNAPTVSHHQELFREEGITGADTLELRFTGVGNLDAIEVLPVNRPWFLTATSAGPGVSLNWTGTNAAPGGYKVKRATAAGGPYTLLPGPVLPTTTFQDSAVTSGQTYFYVVEGVTATGTATPPSNEASATPGGRIGLDGRWPYVSIPATTATGYVDLANGNLVLPVTDALIPSGPLAVVARRTYNSQDRADRGLGRGWRLNVHQELEFGGSSAVWTDGDGSRTILTRQADGSYKGEAQTFVTLAQPAAGVWEITRKDGLRHRFGLVGSTWRMTAMADRNGNEIRYEYDAAGRVQFITPSSGAQWTLTYDPVTGLLTELTDGSKLPDRTPRKYRYEYDGGFLSRVTSAGLGVTTYGYDADGQLTAITDPAGRTTRVEYAAGRVAAYIDGVGGRVAMVYLADRTAVTDPLQRTTAFYLNTDGRLVKSADAGGGVTAFQYDTAGNLTTWTDALNRVTTLAGYDAWGDPGTITNALGKKTIVTYHPTLHLPVTETDPMGRRTEYVYDARGNLTSVVRKGADGVQLSRVQYTYDLRGLRTTAVDPRAFDDPAVLAGDAAAQAKYTTAFQYDAKGWLTKIIDPLGGTTAFGYDDAGNRTSQVDPLQRTTTYTYSADGLLTRVVLPDGATELREYDAAGYLIRQTDPIGAVVSYEYDGAGRPQRITDALRGVTAFQYDAAGQRIAVVDARGNVTHTQYDLVGRPVAVTDPEGHVTRTDYDAVGNAVQVTLPNGYAIAAEYDVLNRQIKVTEPPSVTETQYDDVGNPTLLRDANGRWTRFEYDGLNRLIRAYDALNLDGAGKPIASATYTSYEYDAGGNRTKVTDALQNRVTIPAQRKSVVYQYDLLNQVRRTINQLGKSEYFSYDAAGQLTQAIDANGTIKSYRYDLRGNLLAIQAGDSCSSIRFEYDKAGRQVASINSSGVVSSRYDVAGRLLEEIDPTGVSTQYRYDAVGNVTAVTLREGTWQYAYDGSNRLTEVTDPEGTKSAYRYTDDGRVASVLLPHGVTLINGYNAITNRLESQTYKTTSTLATYRYEYDTKGNVTKADNTTYTYDALDRLVAASYNLGDGNLKVMKYTYDAADNRLAKWEEDEYRHVSNKETYTYDAANRILEVSRKSSVAERYVYDDAGRLLMVNRVDKSSGISGGTRYEYDRFDRLVKESNGDTVTTYGYDANGRRLFRKALLLPGVTASEEAGPANQVYYQYALGQVVSERDGAGTAQAFVTRGLGGSLLTLHRPKDGKFVYITDRLGSVRQLIDKDKKKASSYVYDEFGNVTEATGTVQNDWKFTGQIMDPGTGLYHLSARYYNPNDGRFITQDTWKGSAWAPWTQNLYTYVGNNPVNYVDPTGHFACPAAIPNCEEAAKTTLTVIQGGQGAAAAGGTSWLSRLGPWGIALAVLLTPSVADANDEQRLIDYDVSKSTELKAALEANPNVFKKALNAEHYRACQSEMAGIVVLYKEDGQPFDHCKEVWDYQQGVFNKINQLKDFLNDSRLYEPTREFIRQRISTYSRMLDASESFFRVGPSPTNPLSPYVPRGVNMPMF